MNGPSSANRPLAAYVHIPFCVSKCWYCDFNSYAGLEPIFDDYVHALITEIERTASLFPPYEGGTEGGSDLEGTPAPPGGPSGASGPLDSVYFGGGTPTVLTARQLADILDTIRRTLRIAPDCEVTVEANPGTVDDAKLSALREAGFNRLSLGVQSFDDEFLQSIGRAHTSAQALDAYAAARKAGFENVGIDLMFALPGQTVEHWRETLDTAIELNPEHVSLYELSIEEGTRFAELCADGEITLVDEDTRIEMYELAETMLGRGALLLGRDLQSRPKGYEHYEVSNFALPGFRSRHNTTYWLNQPYYGFGAGATSYINGTRARRVAHARDYIAAVTSGSDAIESSETLGPRPRLGETIVLGLRMLEGVDLARVRSETGFDPLAEYAPQIDRLTHRGLIEITDTRLRVTHEGLLLLNDVAGEFV